MSKLEKFIEKNLPRVLAEDTASSLGDRSKYIGASDIGSCLRKGYLSKKYKVEHDIAQHIVFERGHIAEGIVEKMLHGTPYKTQVEVKGKTENGYDIKAHIDFTVDFGTECVVIEAKSTSRPVEEPYDSWVLQVQMQMGLLASQCEDKKIRGYVIAIDVNTGWYKTFEILPNKILLNIAMSKANILADALVDDIEPQAEIQLYCSKCAFKHNCPAISNLKGDSDLPEDIVKAISRLSERAAVEREIKELKVVIQRFLETTGLIHVKAAGRFVTLMKMRGKKSVDLELLRNTAPDIYSKVECYDKGYSFLKVV